MTILWGRTYRMTAIHILIACRDPDAAARMRFALRRMGFASTLAATGAEALDLARQDPQHLFVLDEHLLDLGGLDVARQLRRANRSHRPPIVLLSANPPSLDAQLRDELGIVTTLRHPASSAALIAAVETSLLSSDTYA
jgi:DNA-binding response OmpR family regulator